MERSCIINGVNIRSVKKQSLKFGDVEIEKRRLHSSKSAIGVCDVSIDK